MEVDSLVRRVQLLGKLLLFASLFANCKQVSNKALHEIIVDAAFADSYFVDGKLHVHGVPFSGKLFGLHENSSDTAFISHYLNGLEEGEWRKFYTGHKLSEQRFYHQGKKVGELKSWWENGQRQMLYRFDQDEYEGTCCEWNPQGVLVRELHYHRGHEEGSQRQWYDNGTVRSNYMIKNGRRYGLLGTKNCVNVADSIAFDQ